MRDIFSTLSPWRIFCKVADTGSLSRAAVELDLEVSRVSRTIAEIEKALGSSLFDRSTRPLRLTKAAESLLGKVKPCLSQWDAFERSVTSPDGVRHTVRLSTPAGIGRFYLNQQIAEYSAIDPTITLETTVEAGIEELLAEQIDVAFVSFLPERSDLNVYPAMNAFTIPLASVHYVERFGNPSSPEELIFHTGILKTGKNFPVANYLIRRSERRTVFWKQVIRHIDMLNIKDAVLRGYGIAVDIPLGMVLDEIRSGELVRVLDNWHRDYWHYAVATRAADTVETPAGRFAAWYARRATAEIDARREEGFRLLGFDPTRL